MYRFIVDVVLGAGVCLGRGFRMEDGWMDGWLLMPGRAERMKSSSTSPSLVCCIPQGATVTYKVGKGIFRMDSRRRLAGMTAERAAAGSTNELFFEIVLQSLSRLLPLVFPHSDHPYCTLKGT
jgi:hypothetical protein